jgi:hypothetical protein
MQRILSALILLVFLSLLPAAPVKAWFFDNDTLVSIDGTDYTTEDFKRWWEFWKEEGMSLPETPDPYIDWLLLAREGRSMDLESDPGFKRATTVFLQSRTLLKLKYEAVDSQINVTDSEVRKHYDEHFVPRWVLGGMEFQDKAAAAAVWKELSDGSVTIESILDRKPESGGPVKTADMSLRPRDLEKSQKWKSIYQDLSVGQVVDPVKIGESKVLWYMKEQKGADDEDFTREREGIYSSLWDQQERALTRELIDALREKYEVEVDFERLDALDMNADDATFTDAPIVTSSKQNISEKDFVAIMRRVMETRPMLAHSLGDKEAMQPLKRDTVYNVLAQTLTNWESIDRHYEEKEPFKWEYEFNYNHRLVLGTQQRLFSDQAKITGDEIKQHYEKNKARYAVPARAKLIILDESQGPIDQVWADVAVGKSMEDALKKHFEKHPGLQDVPINHLDPEIKTVVEGLSQGETSQIFTVQGVRVLVHVSQIVPEKAIAFERVKDPIHRELFQKKIDQLQDTYLTTVKSSAEIEVQQQKWEAVRKELGGA